jgi:3-oxoacyl-(acyl-carrier-protein) synthase
MTACLPHTLLDGALKVRAEEYASTLYVGATVDANDRAYLDGTGWAALLDEALADRGLRLDGDQVVPGPYKRQPTEEATS